jgi:uncharacterized protein YcsI (UPF0317 family)
MAEGDYVMVHGRFTNIGQPKAWGALDIVRPDGRPIMNELMIWIDESDIRYS